MKPLNILIVEDEVLIAETIKMYLEEIGYNIAGIAISYDQALEIINSNHIDIALIDIRLYGPKSGIDLANYFSEIEQKIPFIFLTAQYDKRILEKALKTDPMGYLVKPIQKASLYTTIETAYDKIKKSLKKNNLIQIKSGKTTHIVESEKVVMIKADHVYCEIHTNAKDIFHVRDSLSKLIKKFNSDKIVRCHRSYAINYAHIMNWSLTSVELTNNLVVPISRSFRNEMMDILNQSI